MTTSALSSVLLKDRPIFSRQLIRHSPPHPVVSCVASNLQICLVLANKSIQRINQAASSKDSAVAAAAIETLDLSKWVPGSSKIVNAFLDPLGVHLILVLKGPELQDVLYLNRKSGKPKTSSKVKGHLITSVAWLSTNTSDAVTGPILMGTSRGLIVETELIAGEERLFSNNLESYWKPVFDIGKGQHVPITGLEFHQVPNSKRFFILATTASRLYQFQGTVGNLEDRPMLLNVFNDYSNQPDKFLEFPSMWKQSHLAFFYEPKEKGKSFAKHPLFPKSFGWMTEPGMYAGSIDAQQLDTVTVDCQLVQFPDDSAAEVEGGSPTNVVTDAAAAAVKLVPKAFLLSEFHALIAYEDRVRGVCLLNQQQVFEAEFDLSAGKVKGMSRDPISGSFYVYSDYAIHKFKVDGEERNVWKVYLEQEDFERAQMYCSGDEDKLDLVLQRQAQQLFDRGQYLESAMHFAKTRCSFESTVLKFIDLPEKTALMNYLKKKLEFTKDRMETALVVVWLVDVYLTKMSDTEQMDEDDGDGPEAIAEELEHLKADFLNLLKTPKIAECVDQNKTSLYELMSDHGHVANMIKFADVTNDYERLIKFYIQNNQFQPVLDTLREQRRPNLYYEYGSALMREKPQQLVDLFIAEGRRLNPVRIVPCLAACRSPEQEIQAMKYLEFSVNQLGSRAPATHNFLISLYIKHSPEKVDPYLKEQGFEVEQIPYDVKYTLRLCKERGLNRECVTLHCVLGQLEEAVSLALNTVDLEQAKLCLQFAEEDKEMRRKIWLKIARYVVEQKNDIKQAMEYLQECDGLVKIEDILPFFPDFVTIDHFKDAICDSLQDYSKYIAELREEMDDSNRSADKIREEIQSYKNSYHFVRATDTCSLCKTGYLMERPFHLFGCGHKFHTDCLVYEVLPLLSSGKRRKVEEIWKEINFVRHSNISNSNSSAGGSGSDDPRWQQQQQPQQDKISRSEQLKMDLDDLVAADCVACGEIVVKMIDKPFIPDASFDAVIKEWL